MSSATAKVQDPSMEEILASIRRIIADDGESARGFSAAAPVRTSVEPPPILDEPDPEPTEATLPAGPPEPEPIDPEPNVDEAAFEPPRDEAPEPPRAEAPEVIAPEPARPHPEPAPQPDALISNATTSSVAQAFGLLSHTVLTHNSQTLEDLVKDMLKPMLRMWLDDNLPPLVERLVRHEIERVARGGR